MTGLVAVVGTVAAYLAAEALAARLGRPAWATPLLTCSIAIWAALEVLDVPVREYVRLAGSLRWVLGLATVALGVPLARAIRTLEGPQVRMRIGAAVLVGGFATAAAAATTATALGGSDEVVAAAATKSVSAPIALAIDLPVAVDDGLLAAACVVAGLFGAVLLPPLARRLGITDARALGAGVGVTAHAIGSAQLRRSAPDAVGWAAAGLAVNGVATAIWLPPLLGAALGTGR